MSIVHTLKKIVDPVAAREEERQLRSRREQRRQDAQGAPPGSVCKVCGYRGPDRSYCPLCLADTMVTEEEADATASSADQAEESHKQRGTHEKAEKD